MLPETSSMTISRMGWGVLSNSVIGCGFPSSRTSKSSRVRVGDQTAVPIRHRDEDTHGLARAAESRLLFDRTENAEDARSQRPVREKPVHAHHSVKVQAGTPVISWDRHAGCKLCR